jgi:hypothetical protein
MLSTVRVGLEGCGVCSGNGGINSLLTHNEHEKVSPTYAEPNEVGRVRRGVRVNLVSGTAWWAREALGWTAMGNDGSSVLGEGE